MAVLTWKHGTTREVVRQLIQSRLQAAGVSDKVKWTSDSFSVSVGWGVVLNLVGEITDEFVILKKASGVLGPVVISKSREAFQDLFPHGEQLNDANDEHSTKQKSVVQTGT